MYSRLTLTLALMSIVNIATRTESIEHTKAKVNDLIKNNNSHLSLSYKWSIDGNQGAFKIAPDSEYSMPRQTNEANAYSYQTTLNEHTVTFSIINKKKQQVLSESFDIPCTNNEIHTSIHSYGVNITIQNTSDAIAVIVEETV